MSAIYKILFILFLSMGLIFARSGRNNPTVDKKNIKSQYSLKKDQYDESGKTQLERKRTHKRRRKIRKPIKGLR